MTRHTRNQEPITANQPTLDQSGNPSAPFRHVTGPARTCLAPPVRPPLPARACSVVLAVGGLSLRIWASENLTLSAIMETASRFPLAWYNIRMPDSRSPDPLAAIAHRHRNSTDRALAYALIRTAEQHGIPTDTVYAIAVRHRPRIAHNAALREALTNTVAPPIVHTNARGLVLSRAAARLRECVEPGVPLPQINVITIFVLVGLWECEAREKGYTTALVSTRDVGAWVGVDRRTANTALHALLERGWVREVGHTPRQARRLCVAGGSRISAEGQAIAGDPEHPLWRVTDPQVVYHSDRTRAVRAWVSELLEALGIDRKPRGNRTPPPRDPDAPARMAEALEVRSREREASASERARDLELNAVVREIIGTPPKRRTPKAERRAWLEKATTRAHNAIGNKGTPERRTDMRRAIEHALKIRGYPPTQRTQIAHHLVPLEVDNG